MNNIETNPFPFFIPAHTRLLIVGSFPCFNGRDYGNWYYSGSGRNYFWQLLSAVYGMPAGSRQEKLQLCEKHGIAMSDVALRIIRTRNNCSDANLKVIEWNTEGLTKCLAAGPEKILFTGRFPQAQFSKMFPGRNLPMFVLPSPSPAANRHLGGLAEYRDLKKSGNVTDLLAYRLEKYRQLLLNDQR